MMKRYVLPQSEQAYIGTLSYRISSKSRRMEKGRRIQSTRNAGARARFALSKWTSAQVRGG